MNASLKKKIIAAVIGLIVLVLGYFGYDAAITEKPTTAPAVETTPAVE